LLNELYELLPDANIILLDEAYALPTRESVEQNYSKVLKFNLKALSASTYVRTCNDCDNFAFFAFWCARIADKPPGKEVAFGVALTETHAMNVFATITDGKFELLAYEPQDQTISNVDPTLITHIIM
jgi:hypothetical protein